MQCKDISEKPILEFLLKNKGIKWCNNFTGDEFSVRNAMPYGIPWKLVVAKMRQMIKKGLVGGCDCGCRGDYVITEKGELKLNEQGQY